MYNNLLSLSGLFHVLSFFVLPVIFFYIIFAFVITRQVRLLNKSFSSPAAFVLSAVAAIHLLFSIVVALFALMNL